MCEVQLEYIEVKQEPVSCVFIFVVYMYKIIEIDVLTLLYWFATHKAIWMVKSIASPIAKSSFFGDWT